MGRWKELQRLKNKDCKFELSTKSKKKPGEDFQGGGGIWLRQGTIKRLFWTDCLVPGGSCKVGVNRTREEDAEDD